MLSKFIVSKIYKHNIIRSNTVRGLIHQIKLSALLLLLIISLVVYGKYYEFPLYSTVAQIINPTESLYNDMSTALFASNIKLKELKIILPIKCANAEVSGGQIVMTPGDNIMVISPESGVVTDMGMLNSGGKYIKIMMGNNYYVVIENLEVVGVNVGDNVKKGVEIATIMPNTKIIMKLYEGDSLLNNYQIHKSQIIWID